MITGEKLKTLYLKTKDQEYITTKELLNLDLTTNDITKLVSQEKITRISRGLYKLAPITDLLGKDLDLIQTIEYAQHYKLKKGHIITPTKEDLEFIANIYLKIMNGEKLILLESLDSEKRHTYHYLFKAYPELFVFNLPGDIENTKHIVVRKTNREKIDKKELSRIGNAAYFHGDYEKAIEYLTPLTGVSTAALYAKIGFSYYQLHDYHNALQYLIVAEKIFKIQNKDFKFKDIIKRIKSLSKEDELQKIYFKEQSNQVEDLNISDFTNYIINNNMNVSDALRNLGYSEEIINEVRLIYAREYYKLGNIEKGNQFFKAYEQSCHKTPYLKEFAHQIMLNKKLYVHQKNSSNVPLTLKLKP